MYLVVFTLMMVSILGIYTQAAAVQASRLYEQQTAASGTMLLWHGATRAAVLANQAAIADRVSGGASGCVMTSLAFSNDDLVYLSCGFESAVTAQLPVANQARWNTVVYIPSGSTNMVLVTYGEPSVRGNAASPIADPPMGFSPAQVLKQFRKINLPLGAYGSVTNEHLVTMSGALYPTPTTPNNIPDGSVFLLSTF